MLTHMYITVGKKFYFLGRFCVRTTKCMIPLVKPRYLMKFKTVHLLHLKPTYIVRVLIELNVSSYVMGFQVSSFTIEANITGRKYLLYTIMKTRSDERQFVIQLNRINLRDNNSKSFP